MQMPAAELVGLQMEQVSFDCGVQRRLEVHIRPTREAWRSGPNAQGGCAAPRASLARAGEVGRGRRMGSGSEVTDLDNDTEHRICQETSHGFASVIALKPHKILWGGYY